MMVNFLKTTSYLIKDDPTALQIQLYYDELEVCNPLGSKAKKHKLGRNDMSMHTAFKIFLQVCCISFSADNLAAWSVGGFKALGSAFRRCQYCMVTCEDMQTKVSLIIMPQRTMARLYIMLIYSLQKIAYN